MKFLEPHALRAADLAGQSPAGVLGVLAALGLLALAAGLVIALVRP